MADNIEVPVNASACRRIEYDISVSYSEDPTLLPRLDELNGASFGVTSSAKLAAALESKAAVASAIEAKGVEVANAPFSEYAAKIREIKAATPEVEGTPGNGFPVRFFDYDGTLLKTHYVHKGEDATPPELPEHELLSFQRWNNDYTNIQGPTDTGALYDTKDGASYFFVRFLQGDSRTIWLRHTVTGGTSTVEWGDGTSDVNESTEEFVTSHTYETPGDYMIRLSGSDGAVIACSNYYMCSPSNGWPSLYVVRKLFLSSKMSTGRLPVAEDYSLSEISTPQGNALSLYSFCYRLKALILPSSIVTLSRPSFRQCRDLEQLVLPNVAIGVTGDCFDEVYLKTLVYPAKVTSISVTTWGRIEKIVMRGTNPPTLTTNNKLRFGKIYVPEGSLSAYQTATNWSAFADIMEEYTEETILW